MVKFPLESAIGMGVNSLNRLCSSREGLRKHSTGAALHTFRSKSLLGRARQPLGVRNVCSDVLRGQLALEITARESIFSSTAPENIALASFCHIARVNTKHERAIFRGLLLRQSTHLSPAKVSQLGLGSRWSSQSVEIRFSNVCAVGCVCFGQKSVTSSSRMVKRSLPSSHVMAA